MMALNPPVPGLRVVHDSRFARKVEVVVPAGDVLVVSEAVAVQLHRAATQFKAVPEAVVESVPEARPAKKAAAKKAAGA